MIWKSHREKAVNPKTIERYLDFLNGVKDNALPYECQVSLSTLCGNYAVSKTAPKILEALKVIERVDRHWNWIGGEPSKEMVLTILDMLLHKNKKTVHTHLMPELATAVTAIKELTDTVRVYITQSEKSLKGLKINPVEQAIHGETLFSEQQKRFELAGGITKALCTGRKCGEFDEVTIRAINNTAIRVADDLLKQLNAVK